MRIKSLLSILLLTSSSAYATDWNKLIELAPSAKKERVQLDEKGYVTANVVKLPSGKLRFLGFNNFGIINKPVIVVEAKTQDLDDLCLGGVHLNEPFKAKLTMQVNAAAGLTTGFLGTGSKLDEFDNPVKVGKPVLSFSKSRPKWTMYDMEAMKNTKGTLGDYYLGLLNDQLLRSDGNTLTMDLSKLNAFACDLMAGNMTIQVNQSVEAEAGMPAEKSWLELEQYAAIYRKFWNYQPLIINPSQTALQNQLAEAVALGVSIGSTLPAAEVLKSAPRVQKFLFSVKSDVRNLAPVQKASVAASEVMQAWNMNTEFVIPENLVHRQTRTVLDDAVFVKFTR